MAARLLTLTPAAYRDLIDIEAYLRQEAGPSVAAQNMERIVRRAGNLLAFPQAAPVDWRLDGAPRVAIIRPWKIIYDYLEARSEVFVWRIVHGSRDLPNLVRRPTL